MAVLVGCIGIGDRVAVIRGEIRPLQPQVQHRCSLSFASGFRIYGPEFIEGRFERMFILVPNQPITVDVECVADDGDALFSRRYNAGPSSEAKQTIELGVITF